MTLSRLLVGMLAAALLAAAGTGQLAALGTAAAEGAQSAVTLCLALAGPICLWSGLGEAMRENGMGRALTRLCRPLLRRLFPQSFRDEQTAESLCANVGANLLGLGNAATPMGIDAVRRMPRGRDGAASDEMCRFVVLNTASIQLLPTTLAALRGSLGAAAPFDLLPAIWLTSFCALTVGLASAALLRRLWRS